MQVLVVEMEAMEVKAVKAVKAVKGRGQGCHEAAWQVQYEEVFLPHYSD
jgi:hypothetical protein